MKAREDLGEVVRYLVDVQDEYSPSRFRLYIASVKSHMPKNAYQELEAALEELMLAHERVDRAVMKMRPGDLRKGGAGATAAQKLTAANIVRRSHLA